MNIDADIENFYLLFKDSMLNFYKEHTFTRPLLLWSNILNNLQKEQCYEEIEKKIKKIISLYAIDLMKVSDTYKISILVTNIKRWNKLTDKHQIHFDTNKNNNIVFLLLDIYSSMINKIDNEFKILYQQVELFIIYYDFTSLIDYSIKNNRYSIIDKLQTFDVSIINYIIDMYNLTIDKNTPISSRKLFKLINNK
tara:strand:- start:21068 stop:21652 length:585 start_codon:yes stop_codon:yes gene_type:complete